MDEGETTFCVNAPVEVEVPPDEGPKEKPAVADDVTSVVSLNGNTCGLLPC